MADSDFRLYPEGDASVVIRRSFEAEAEEVIRAHLDPEQLPKWMGAPEMPLALCEVDARPGGRYRMAWTRPDGSQSWIAGHFVEIAEARIAFTEYHRPDWVGGETQVIVEARDHDDRAFLRKIVTFSSPQARGKAIGAMAPGTAACLDRLEVLLGSTEEEEEDTDGNGSQPA